jgi:shikimate dehydrogenase
MMLSGKAKVAGVIGWPVAHSRSPRLHGYWLDKHGIDGAYIPLAVPPDRLEQALQALPALGLRGVNVTLPHKEGALRACERIDPLARRIGAVNTIVVGSNGELEGSNTDAFGLIENLRQGSQWRSGDGPAVILGAGGAARSACVALIDAGVSSIRIVNRTIERAAELASAMAPHCVAVAWDRREDSLDGAALVINTTNLGMTGQQPLEIRLDSLPVSATVYDIVYAPLETDLLAAARARGNPAVDGLGMLLHQARPGFEAWFGIRPEVDEGLRNFVLQDLRETVRR